MALRLALARTAEVRVADRHSRKRTGTGDRDVFGNDLAVLEGEDVEAAAELFGRQHERRGQTEAAPAGRERDALREIRKCEAVDQRQRVHALAVVRSIQVS